jgi:uncharacterized protein DUF4350
VPSRRFVTGVVAGALFVTALVLWIYPSTTDFANSNTHWNGMSDASREFRIRPLTDVGGLPSESRGTVAVVIPSRPPQPTHLQAIRRFVEGGGVLILLDNFGSGNDVLTVLGSAMRFSGRLLADPLFNLKNSRLPRILDFAPSPLTVGVEELVFNHATVLTDITTTQAAATSSAVSYLALNPTGQRDEGSPRGPFPVLALEPLKEGYIVALSDSSILINSMLPQADNRRLFRNAIGLAGANARIFLDDALLPQAPLDATKHALADTRLLLGGPAAVFALVVAALVLPTVLLSKSSREITQ